MKRHPIPILSTRRSPPQPLDAFPQRRPTATRFRFLAVMALVMAAFAGALSAQNYRGAQVGGNVSAADLIALRTTTNANLIRWYIHVGDSDARVPAVYDAEFERSVQHLRNVVLPTAASQGMRVVVVVLTPPGGVEGSPNHHRMLMAGSATAWARQSFRDKWRNLATTLLGNPTVYGYDLLNEPGAPDRRSRGIWRDLAVDTARTIRSVDPTTRIILEPPYAATGTLNVFRNVPNISNLAMSVHVYWPSDYTHQGVAGRPTPRPFPTRRWSGRTLRSNLTSVLRFQQRTGVPIYIGEFGVARWAPGAEHWLRECIRIFEAADWDWTYHAWRESPVWNHEMSADPNNTDPQPGNPRIQTLIDAMRANTAR